MRVTHVITRLIVGGAQENTVASILGLRQKPDLEVSLISGSTYGAEGSLEPLLAGFPGVLRIEPDLVRPVRPLKDFLALRGLTRWFQQEKPQIVHTHSGKAGILGRLAAQRAGVPIIIHTIHGPSFGPFQGPIPNLAFRYAERRAAKATTHFVVVAEAMQQQYLAAGIGRPELYSHIPSGFQLEPFLTVGDNPKVRAALGLRPDDIVVGTIARLCPLKGHDDLLTVAPELMRRFPRIKFLWVGDGEWRDRFTRRVRELRLADAFVFTGLVQPDAVPPLVGAMDILAHLSRREGLARALPQALAAGRPVVAYDCDGAREVCLDNQTGFLIPPGNLSVLQARLLTLSADPALRRRLGQAGASLVRERFTLQRMIDKLYDLYVRLAAAGAVTCPMSTSPLPSGSLNSANQSSNSAVR